MSNTVMLIDDEPHILAAYQRRLGKQFDIVTADSPKKALELIESHGPFAVVVSDLRMPGMDGVTLLKTIRDMSPETARIMLTGYGDLGSVVEAVNEGRIHKYLTKPTPAGVLAESIREAMAYHAQQTSMQAAAGRLTTEAVRHRTTQQKAQRIDATTGLPNRKSTLEALERKIERHAEDGGVFTVVVVDIDNFTKLNATWGAEAGDQVLSVVADRLASVLDEGGVIGRWGSDSILFSMDFGEVSDLVRDVLDGIGDIVGQGVNWDCDYIPVALSMGAARYPNDGDDAKDLIHRAEIALERARAGTAPNPCVYSPEPLPVQDGRPRMLAIDQLELHYQPQIDIKDGKPVAAEALLRWRQPDGELKAPADFNDEATRAGLIVPIGAWAVAEACRTAARWRDRGLRIPVAVNISALQVDNPGFVDTVKDAVKQSGIDPDMLELEINECEMLRATETVNNGLEELDAFGVRLCIDDFGSQYASLGNLVSHPFKKMKLEPAFVARMDEDKRVETVLRWTIGLADACGMRIVVEGVETEAQKESLLTHGCYYAQGYLFCEPLTEEDFLARYQPN